MSDGLGGNAGAPGRSLPAALATLKDLSGIMGSFIFTHSGQVVAREIPSLFDDDALVEAGQRLTRMREAFASVGDELELAVMRFSDHRLYLKVVSGGAILCILADGAVNFAALRMAANLVGRRIGPELERLGALGTSVPVVAPAVTSAPVAAPAAVTPGESAPVPAPAARPPVFVPGTGRRFRGRTVE